MILQKSYHLLGIHGTLRDDAYYSAIAPEWPAVKAGLERMVLLKLSK